MYNVIMDSCGEIPISLQNDERFHSVPIQLEVNGDIIMDDANFNREKFLMKMEISPNEPHSACPSPEDFMKHIKETARNYIVTLSSWGSGSFNSAKIASELYHEEDNADTDITVIDSKTASVGETLIALKIKELEELKLHPKDIKNKLQKYVSEIHTYFVCETLDTFRKSGRLKGVKSIAAGALNIKPICMASDKGEVVQINQARGVKKALNKMVEYLLKNTQDCENKVLAIAHCACPDRAEYVKSLIEKAAKFKDIIIVNTSGVSTMYINRGGIVISA